MSEQQDIDVERVAGEILSLVTPLVEVYGSMRPAKRSIEKALARINQLGTDRGIAPF